jgi:hypothetical protein
MLHTNWGNREYLFHYWQVVLFTLLLGFYDLYNANIGILENGNFFLFDNESTFPHISTISPIYHEENGEREICRVDVPFINTLIDLPIAYEPLDSELKQKLDTWLQTIKYRLDDVHAYFSHPLTRDPPSKRAQADFFERCRKLIDFFENSFCLHQVVEHIFPYYHQDFLQNSQHPLKEPSAYFGLEGLQSMVQEIFQRTPRADLLRISSSTGDLTSSGCVSNFAIPPSTALIFLSKFMHWWPLIQEEEKKRLFEWASTRYKLESCYNEQS